MNTNENLDYRIYTYSHENLETAITRAKEHFKMQPINHINEWFIADIQTDVFYANNHYHCVIKVVYKRDKNAAPNNTYVETSTFGPNGITTNIHTIGESRQYKVSKAEQYKSDTCEYCRNGTCVINHNQ